VQIAQRQILLGGQAPGDPVEITVQEEVQPAGLDEELLSAPGVLLVDEGGGRDQHQPRRGGVLPDSVDQRGQVPAEPLGILPAGIVEAVGHRDEVRLLLREDGLHPGAAAGGGLPSDAVIRDRPDDLARKAR